MTELYEREITEAFASLLDDVHPDLAGIAARAELEGARLRRRRRTTTGLAALATAACVGVGGVAAADWLPGGDSKGDGTREVIGQPAAQPGAETPFTFAVPQGWACEDAVTQSFSCMRGDLQATVTWAFLEPEEMGVVDTQVRPAGGIAWRSPDREVIVLISVDEPAALDVRDEFDGAVGWEGTEHNDFVAAPIEESDGSGVDPERPFVIDVPAGWECGEYADEKVPCTSKSGAGISVNVRAAADHDVWASSPDKGGPGTGVRVSEVHGDWFVSLQPATATEADKDLIAAALTWTDGTPVF